MVSEVSTHPATSYVTLLFFFFCECESSLDCVASLYFNLPPPQEKLFVWERTSEIIHHSKQKDNLCFISDPPCRVECFRIGVWDYTPPSAPPDDNLQRTKKSIALKTFSSRPRLCFVHFSWLWNIYIFKITHSRVAKWGSLITAVFRARWSSYTFTGAQSSQFHPSLSVLPSSSSSFGLLPVISCFFEQFPNTLVYRRCCNEHYVMSDSGIVLLCAEQWHKSDVSEPFHGGDTICPEATDPETVRTEPASCKQLLYC